MFQKTYQKKLTFIFITLFLLVLLITPAVANVTQQTIEIDNITTEGFDVVFNISRAVPPAEGDYSTATIYYIVSDQFSQPDGLTSANWPITLPLSGNYLEAAKEMDYIKDVVLNVGSPYYYGSSPKLEIRGLKAGTTYFVGMMADDGTQSSYYSFKNVTTEPLPYSPAIEKVIRDSYFAAVGEAMSDEITSAELRKIESLNLSGIQIENTQELMFIKDMTAGTSQLKHLDLSETGITDLPNIFYDSNMNITTLILPETLKKGYAIGGSITELTIPDGTEEIHIFGNFTSLDVPESVKIISVKSAQLVEELDLSHAETVYYIHAPKLTSIKFPDRMTEFYSTKAGLFERSSSGVNNTAITEIIVPYSVNRIGGYVFPNNAIVHLPDKYIINTGSQINTFTHPGGTLYIQNADQLQFVGSSSNYAKIVLNNSMVINKYPLQNGAETYINVTPNRAWTNGSAYSVANFTAVPGITITNNFTNELDGRISGTPYYNRSHQYTSPFKINGIHIPYGESFHFGTFDELETLIQEAEAKEQTSFSEGNWNILQTEITNAKSTLNKKETLNDNNITLFNSYGNLNKAVQGISPSTDSLKTLENLRDKGKEYKESDYNAEIWDSFKDAYDKADALLKSDAATQYEVDQASAYLKRVMDGMVKESEIVSILHLGWKQMPAIEKAAQNMYHSGYINYTYMDGFDEKDDSVDLSNVEFDQYDIVIFDMISFDPNYDVALEKAVGSGTTLIGVNGGSEPDYFTAVYTASSDFKYYNQVSAISKLETDAQNIIAQQWGEKFLLNLVIDSANTERKELENTVKLFESQKFEVLYIGDEGPDGVEGLQNAVLRQDESIYGGIGSWTAFLKTDIESVKTYLQQHAGTREPLIIVCDSFTNEDWTTFNNEFDFKSMQESGTKILSIRNAEDLPEYTVSDSYITLSGFGGTDDKSLEVISTVLFQISKRHGTDLTSIWEYTIPPEATPSIGLYNRGLDGERVYFADLDSYLEWYETKGSSTGHFYNDANCTVGIWIHVQDRDAGNAVDELIVRLEENGINVITGYETYDDLPKYYCFNGNPSTPAIDVGLSVKNFGLNYYNHDEGIRQLEAMNIPIIKGIFPYSEGTSISDENKNIDSSIISRSVLSPNRDGLFEFIVLGYNDTGKGGGSAIFEHQVDWTAEIIKGWGNLRHTPNEAKEIAFIYYNYPPGKDGIGANYLNVIRSITGDGGSNIGILREMDKSDYTIDFFNLPVATMQKGGSFTFKYGESDSQTMTEENLINLMYSQGINVGSHAPGVLNEMVQTRIDFENDPSTNNDDWWGCQLIPVDLYSEWFWEDITDEDLRSEILKVWGAPWDFEVGKDEMGMMWVDETGHFGDIGGKYFVIPAIRVGNVWLMPQPDRALAGEKGVTSVDYHGDLPPTHQYVAFYLWLNRGMDDQEFKPDALIHFGTHGTHEWLPGTSIGLDRNEDWAPSLIQGLPNIYPYIMANVGEGLTAEFRGNALIIEHLTPAMIRSGLYGELLEIDAARQGYMKQASLGVSKDDESYGAIVVSYRKIIVEKVFSTGSHEAMNLDEYRLKINPSNKNKVTNDELKAYLLNLNDKEFTAFVDNHVHTYIETVLESSIPYGMHVYGQSPNATHSASMIRAMWGNYGFEKVIEKAYFTDAQGSSGIPLQPIEDSTGTRYNGKCDEDVLKLVEDIIKSDRSAKAIEDALKANFGEADPEVVYFIKGPIMYAEAELAKLSNNPSPEELETLNNTVYDKWVQSGLNAELAGAYGSKVAEGKTREFVNLTLEGMRNGVSAERSIDSALNKQYSVNNYQSQSWINEPVVNFLTSDKILSFMADLENSGPREMYALLNALNGGYIPPTSGNDPVQNPDALPTGANFYGIDPSTFPTRAAWDVGQVMGEQILADYYLKYGEFPSTVSFMRFGVEFIRDEGSLEACIYYLLGTYPTWRGNEYGSGSPFDKAVIMDPSDPRMQITVKDANGNVVYEGPRPRVDIVYNTAGMRDGYSNVLRSIQRTIDEVYELGNQSDGKGRTIVNYVTINTNEIAGLLEDAGLSPEEAKRIAKFRTYAQQLGNYEIGTGNMISSGSDWDEQKVAELYLERMGFAYNDDTWGEKMNSDILKLLLARVDASVFASSSNLYDNLDNDDVFQYFGAMNMISSMYNKDGTLKDKSEWKLPEMYIADTSNVENFDPANPGKLIATMQEALLKDMQSRYLNPEWIKGMMESGYSGSTMFSEFVENMFGWSAISNGELISMEVWAQVYDIYVQNAYNTEEFGYLDLQSYFEENPYAYQSMTARMLETIRREYMRIDTDALTEEQQKEMEALRETMKENLMSEYIKSAVDAGIACCHHTCGNPAFDEFMAGSVSVLGLSSDEEEIFWQLVKDATGRDKPEVKVEQKISSSTSGAGYGTATLVEAGEPASGETNDSNEENNEEPDEGNQNPGVGIDGTETGTPTDAVRGFEVTVSNAVNSVRDFIQNPTFSTSSIIAIAIVVLVVGAVFYGFRRRNV
ncbi:cobaltochelatase subunit CobN [Methanimicrococcus hacksteinii]|nr:cobaltochelatase subunit CobN [Methanimicrococcus sp. At1]